MGEAGGLVDLSSPRRIHVVVIGGVGMSAIATVLLAMGHEVSGSHEAHVPVLDDLKAAGANVHASHDARHVGGADLVAASTAAGADHPELVAARAQGIPVVRRAEILAAICAERRTIAVAGTHGKTTTSALLATALDAAGLEPSFIVGAPIAGLGGVGARWAAGEWLVVEADESDGTFLELPAELRVVTNVEPDHLSYWGNAEAMADAFARFLAGGSPAIACADDEGSVRAASRATALGATVATYGTTPGSTWQLHDVAVTAGSTRFALVGPGMAAVDMTVPLPGVHNARNAAAALASAITAGADAALAARGLAGFSGVARRFERRGERDGVTFVDSYDHMPTEVAAVLAAARAGGWDRVITVFQPHRYTRTRDHWRDFASAFDDTDVLVVTELYSAGEPPIEGISGKLVLDAVLEARPFRPAAWLPTRGDLVRYLRDRLRPGDLCLTLGAGDLTTLPDDLLAAR